MERISIMDILSDKLVTTRKEHKCVGCGRIFPIKSQMHRIATAQDGTAYTDYLCKTCVTIMHKEGITEYREGDLYEYAVQHEQLIEDRVRKEQLKVGQIYHHFKGGNYIIEGFALDIETAKDVVIYRALYGHRSLFVRPISVFLDKITDTLYRFTAIDLEM